MVPVQVVPVPPARLLLLAGAPQPEVKYLRRLGAGRGHVQRAAVLQTRRRQQHRVEQGSQHGLGRKQQP